VKTLNFPAERVTTDNLKRLFETAYAFGCDEPPVQAPLVAPLFTHVDHAHPNALVVPAWSYDDLREAHITTCDSSRSLPASTAACRHEDVDATIGLLSTNGLPKGFSSVQRALTGASKRDVRAGSLLVGPEQHSIAVCSAIQLKPGSWSICVLPQGRQALV
jgi:hypothetical protein